MDEYAGSFYFGQTANRRFLSNLHPFLKIETEESTPGPLILLLLII